MKKFGMLYGDTLKYEGTGDSYMRVSCVLNNAELVANFYQNGRDPAELFSKAVDIFIEEISKRNEGNTFQAGKVIRDRGEHQFTTFVLVK